MLEAVESVLSAPCAGSSERHATCAASAGSDASCAVAACAVKPVGAGGCALCVGGQWRACSVLEVVRGVRRVAVDVTALHRSSGRERRPIKLQAEPRIVKLRRRKKEREDEKRKGLTRGAINKKCCHGEV